MAEFLAFLWLGSFLTSLPITAYNLWKAIRKSKSLAYSRLNQNLAGLGLFWSLSSDAFKSLSDSNPEQDLRTSLRSYLLIGGLGFLSLLGLIFLILVSISMHLLLKSRISEKVFRSGLAQVPNLDLETARALVKSFSEN